MSLLESTDLWQLESGDCYAEFVPRMVQIGISKLFEVTREKDQSSLVTVLVGLQTKGALSAEQLLAGISTFHLSHQPNCILIAAMLSLG